MAYKIYTKSNYFYIVDTENDKIFEGLAKYVRVRKEFVDSTSFIFENVNGLSTSLQIPFADIQDENGDAYSDLATFVAFYEANTGNFNSAGASAQYSETEQVIGKWINGKPLYRKVVNFTNPTDTDFVNFDLAEVDFILINGAYVSGGLDKIQIPFFKDSTATGDTGDRIVDTVYGLWTDSVGSDGGVKLVISFFNCTTEEPIYRNGSGYLIFQYTKTTD